MSVYMVNKYFNAADIKAICQARKFDSKCLKSNDMLANSLSSTIGIEDAIATLTDKERIFLHYLEGVRKGVYLSKEQLS